MSRDCQGVKYFGWVAKCNVKYRNLRERKNEICFKLFRNDRTKIHLPNNLNINFNFSKCKGTAERMCLTTVLSRYRSKSNEYLQINLKHITVAIISC